jgi:broad specificity phosphatase PhoE
MKLYFVRHGQSEANMQQIFDGQRLDSLLTETGKAQAQALIDPLRKLGIKRIVSSPLKRARQTAEIISVGLGLDQPIVYDKRLMEDDKGVLSGAPYQDFTVAELMQHEGVEQPGPFRARVSHALLDIYQTELTTLIVSHGGVYSQYITLRDNLPASDFWNIPGPDNASVEELIINWQ